jgi:hypothetical protein
MSKGSQRRGGSEERRRYEAGWLAAFGRKAPSVGGYVGGYPEHVGGPIKDGTVVEGWRPEGAPAVHVCPHCGHDDRPCVPPDVNCRFRVRNGHIIGPLTPCDGTFVARWILADHRSGVASYTHDGSAHCIEDAVGWDLMERLP